VPTIALAAHSVWSATTLVTPGPAEDGADFWGLGLAVLLIVGSIFVVRVAFRPRWRDRLPAPHVPEDDAPQVPEYDQAPQGPDDQAPQGPDDQAPQGPDGEQPDEPKPAPGPKP
jgi:hypothetical protein